MKPRIALFDGNNMIFRAFFAVPMLNTRDGQATNAVMGSLKTFKATVQDLRPDFILLCWDNGKPTFRHEQDATYKAQRPPVNDDLKSQFTIVQDAFSRLKIPQIVAPDGMESDDLVGTLAKEASKNGFEAVIVSSDKDFYQLCDDNIQVHSFSVKKKNGSGLVNVEYIQKEFDVERPMQLVDIKSLTGEKTDNIAGVRGIGPKTATALIKQHGNVGSMVEYMQKNPTTKWADKILENLDVITNAYKLAEINTDCDVPDIQGKHVGKIRVNELELREFFEHYELNSLLSEFSQWSNMFAYAHTFA